MRNPFEKERKTDIGLDMTPGHLVIRSGSGKLPDMFGGSPSRGGDRKAYLPNPVVHPKKQPVTPRVQKKNEGTKAPVSGKVAAPKGGSRKCIVKADMRSYADSTPGGKKGNARYISARLSPFMKNGGSTTWAKVSYIGRDEALDGTLFSYTDQGLLLGWEGKSAISEFGSDPTMTIILSPEDPGADLVELTRRFMEEVYRSNAKEQPRLWVAGIHGNTKHRHVHILVSCRGKKGGDARVSKSAVYGLRLKTGAERILTDMQGARSWAEEAEARRRANNRIRLTGEDSVMFRAIRMRERKDLKEGRPVRPGVLFLSDIKAPPRKDGDGKNGKKEDREKTPEKDDGKTRDRKFRSACSRRLQELKLLGLVSKEGCAQGEWQFSPDAESTLRKAEFEEEFGLTPEDMETMHLDSPLDKGYQGEIMEYAETPDGRSMLFLIREKTPGGDIIHMHRETVTEDRKTRLESVQSVILDRNRIKGFSTVMGTKEHI